MENLVITSNVFVKVFIIMVRYNRNKRNVHKNHRIKMYKADYRMINCFKKLTNKLCISNLTANNIFTTHKLRVTDYLSQ